MATTVLDTFITLFTYKVEGFDKLEKASKKAVEIGKSMQRRVTAPVLAAFGGMVFGAAKFEDGLDNVLGLLETADVGKFEGELQRLQREAVKTGFALGDVNNSLFDNVSALGTGEQALRNFKASQILAIGGNADLSDAVAGQAAVINAYGRDVTDATEVANAFFTSQKFGVTTVADLANNIGKVAPVAKQANVDFKTLMATMSELTLGGLSTEMAATALRGAFISLLKPSDAAREVLEQYDIPVGAAALQTADFTEVLLKLAQAAKENPDALAEMIPETQALTAVAALGEKNIAHLRGVVQAINVDFKNGTGLLESYDRRMAGASMRTKQMWGQLQVSAQVLGEHLLPLFLAGVGVLNRFFNWLEKLSPAGQKMVLVLMGLAAAIGPLILSIGRLIQAVTIIKTALAAWKVAQVGLNLAMFANPIGLVIAAIVALVAWFAVAYAKTGSLGKAFQKMGSDIVGLGQRILKFLLFPINMYVKSLTGMFRLLSKIPGLGKLANVADKISGAQGSANKFVTGSSSSNPFAARETAVPFDPLAPSPAAMAPPAGMNPGSKTTVDGRQFNVTAQVHVNEASDGQQIANQFVQSLETATRNASQNFQTAEADNG